MLKDYIKIIAEKLKSGEKVYLAPACIETSLIAKMLEREYSVLPAGFCDSDTKKWGGKLNSYPSLRICSFDDMISDESAQFFIASPHHIAEIMGTLTMERGVSPRRIVNFQPLEIIKTCFLFASNWIVSENIFHCCCRTDMPTFNHPVDPLLSVQELDATRSGLIDGNIPLPIVCQTCYRNQASYIFSSRRLNSFNFSFRGWCNYKCKYCSANRPELKDYNDNIFLAEYLTALERKNMINDIFSVLLAVGEPTLNEKRLPLYEHCRDKGYILDVFSNCSVFDDSLFDAAREIPVIIRKSVDAGTPETYAKIKGVPFFNRTIDNLRRYKEAPYLALNLKYLIVPGVNDNEADIKGFVDICSELKVDFVTPVFSFLDDEYSNSERAKKMFKLLVDELAARNIMTANVDTLYSEEYHKVYAESF